MLQLTLSWLIVTLCLIYSPFVISEEESIKSYGQWIPVSSAESSLTAHLIPKPLSNSWEHPYTELFVSIAHFRDAERCGVTVDSFIKKAKYPDRLTFGIFILL
jgi:hypothetical protein